jgi:hypothetical protein
LVNLIIKLVVSLVVRKYLLVNKFLKFLLVLKYQLLFGASFLKHGHVKDMAVVTPVLVARWCTDLMLFCKHVLETVQLL